MGLPTNAESFCFKIVGGILSLGFRRIYTALLRPKTVSRKKAFLDNDVNLKTFGASHSLNVLLLNLHENVRIFLSFLVHTFMFNFVYLVYLITPALNGVKFGLLALLGPA